MTERSPSLASKVLSGGTSLLAAQVIGMFFTFVAQRMILSTLTKEENGDLFVERRVADLLVIILCDVGLNGVAMRKLARMPERAEEIIASVAAFRLGMWTIATVIATIYAVATGLDPVNVAVWAGFLLISARTGLLRYAMELPMRSRVRFGLVSTLGILDTVVFMGIIWVLQDQLSARNVIMASFVSILPSAVILTVADRARHLAPARASRAMIAELLRDAIPIMIAVALVNVHDKIDAMMLEWFSTPAEVGIFSAAYQTLAPIMGTIPISAAMVIVPAVARLSVDDPERCARFAMTGLRFLIAAGIGVATVTSTSTPWIIELISKGRYADNAGQFFAFLWMTVPIFMLFYVQELNIALGEQRRNIVITAILAVATIVLGLLLIPTYASFGAIFAKFVAVGTGSAAAYVIFHRVLGQALTLWPSIGAIVATVTCCLCAYVLPSYMPRPLAVAACIVVWIAAVFGSGLLRPSDIRQIRSILRP